MTKDRERQLAQAVWLLREAGLEAAAELLARAWAESSRRPASKAGGRTRTVRVWLSRAREWAQLPADILGLSDSPPAGCMLEEEAEDVAKRCKT
jgi:hypothetical protein